MSTAAEESSDGKKHMPKAIIFSLIIAMVLYVAATLVLTGMQNYRDIIAKHRMVGDGKTKTYVERRTAEGLSYREIKRCLKRFLARSIFRQLEGLGA